MHMRSADGGAVADCERQYSELRVLLSKTEGSGGPRGDALNVPLTGLRHVQVRLGARVDAVVRPVHRHHGRLNPGALQVRMRPWPGRSSATMPPTPRQPRIGVLRSPPRRTLTTPCVARLLTSSRRVEPWLRQAMVLTVEAASVNRHRQARMREDAVAREREN
jgi:hypothetical protein